MPPPWQALLLPQAFIRCPNACLFRIQVVVDTSVRECQSHKELQAEVQRDIERTAADIALLKERVTHERVIRANKEEYAILAKQAEKLPPRSKTEKNKVSSISCKYFAPTEFQSRFH